MAKPTNTTEASAPSASVRNSGERGGQLTVHVLTRDGQGKGETQERSRQSEPDEGDTECISIAEMPFPSSQRAGDSHVAESSDLALVEGRVGDLLSPSEKRDADWDGTCAAQTDD